MSIFSDWLSQSRDEKSLWSCQFEWVDKFDYFLELFSCWGDLVDHIFKTENFTTDLLLDQFIRFNMNSIIINISICLFIDKFRNNLFGWFTPCDIIFNSLQHCRGCQSSLNKNSSIDLPKTKFIKNDLLLFGNISNSSNSNCKE